MKLTLVVMTSGKQEGKAIDIKLPQFLIGRDPQCHLRPASPMISKRHCALVQRDGKAYIHDFGSTNGTLLNEGPVQGEAELQDGDLIKVGPLMFTVRLEGARVAPAKAPAAKPAAKVEAKAPAAAAAATAPAAEAKAPSGDEEDIAAMLLALQDEEGSGSGGSPAVIPDGSTVMELQLPKDTDTGVPAAPDDKNKDKKKEASGDTRSAAASILEKMMRRPRT